MFQRCGEEDHPESEPRFIVVWIGGDARCQGGLARLEAAALQGLPSHVGRGLRHGGAGREASQSQDQEEPTQHGLAPVRRFPQTYPIRPRPDETGAQASRDDRGRGRGKAHENGPASSAEPWDKSETEAHIWVNEPWPLGVIMPSQVPLATYFQAWGS